MELIPRMFFFLSLSLVAINVRARYLLVEVDQTSSGGVPKGDDPKTRKYRNTIDQIPVNNHLFY